jgi:hypothetical protein
MLHPREKPDWRQAFGGSREGVDDGEGTLSGNDDPWDGTREEQAVDPLGEGGCE